MAAHVAEHGISGWYFRVRTPGECTLADTLAQLMDDPERRRQLATQGRAAVRASYTEKIMAEQTWSPALRGPSLPLPA